MSAAEEYLAGARELDEFAEECRHGRSVDEAHVFATRAVGHAVMAVAAALADLRPAAPVGEAVDGSPPAPLLSRREHDWPQWTVVTNAEPGHSCQCVFYRQGDHATQPWGALRSTHGCDREHMVDRGYFRDQLPDTLRVLAVAVGYQGGAAS